MAAASKREKAIVLIIASTTGDGEPPSHAHEFKASLEKSLDHGNIEVFKGLKFSVLALGSSNYENSFCSFGKFIDHSLEQLGGSRIASLALADDQKEQGLTLRSWAKNTGQNACQLLNLKFPDDFEARMPSPLVKAKRASYKSIARLANTLQRTLHQLECNVNSCLLMGVLFDKKLLSDRYALFTIAFPYNPELELVPGDHINIFPENDPVLVNEVLSFLIDVPCLDEIVEWTGNYLSFCILTIPRYIFFVQVVMCPFAL